MGAVPNTKMRLIFAFCANFLTMASGGYLSSTFCSIAPEAGRRGYPTQAEVNYMCYDYHCPRRENIMQLYNGLLKMNKDVRGRQIDCRDPSCTDYIREAYGFCIPCCNAPYADSKTVKFPNCKNIGVFNQACDHYRRHGRYNIRIP